MNWVDPQDRLAAFLTTFLLIFIARTPRLRVRIVLRPKSATAKQLSRNSKNGDALMQFSDPASESTGFRRR
jgi:hypothetical protein